MTCTASVPICPQRVYNNIRIIFHLIDKIFASGRISVVRPLVTIKKNVKKNEKKPARSKNIFFLVLYFNIKETPDP